MEVFQGFCKAKEPLTSFLPAGIAGIPTTCWQPFYARPLSCSAAFQGPPMPNHPTQYGMQALPRGAGMALPLSPPRPPPTCPVSTSNIPPPLAPPPPPPGPTLRSLMMVSLLPSLLMVVSLRSTRPLGALL